MQIDGTSFADAETKETEEEDPHAEHGKLDKGYGKQSSDSLFKPPYKVRHIKKTWKNDMLLRRTPLFDGWIRSQILTPEEKYMRKCLELIHINASKPSSCTISYNINWNSPIDDANLMVFGTVMDTKPIKSLMKTPLLQYPLTKLNHHQRSKSSKKLFTPCYTRGTLQCLWKENEPHFIFFLENPKSVYLATISNHPMEYAYLFHSGQRISSLESKSNLVGKLVLSSSSTFSSHATVLQREFVLFSDTDTAGASQGLGTNLAEVNLPANYELAAVVIRESFYGSGGWGLKFLKNTESDDCSTCIDVILPAGVHGGPRGGPFSLIERWRRGGCCDCGGWDLGCSLTLLNEKINIQRSSTFCELFDQGFSDSLPCLRVVIVEDGLYLVNFGSNFSALQAFAVVVAHIHAQSEVLRPKMYRK